MNLRQGCGIIAAVFFFACPANGQMSGNPPTPVFIGNKGALNEVVMACPSLDDLKAFVNSLVQARQAHDDIGVDQAAETAQGAGCTIFHPGDIGHVIDATGFLVQYDRVRMELDSEAYWIPAEAISPIPGQPNNP